MGASRKLQGEIERVLKKVQEGVDVFDSIWNKVYDTENANQKEKFEADLKKEIKKLQRYRDQIKTWIQSSEIKDKKALLDARKQIEREMERFKVCEKETKTKAFSKEGLGQQPKTDPKEKAKGESRDWLNNMVSDLESQVESFEAEMEGLSVKKGKSRPPRLTHLEESISRHKLHIMKLEMILRLLDNDELSPEQINDVKELVEDYVERNQDDFEDFADVDEIYNSLPLDKMEALENLDAVPLVAPAVVVKEKAAVAAASGSAPTNGGTLKPAVQAVAAQQTVVTASGAVAAAMASSQQISSSPELIEENLSQETLSEAGTVTPPLSVIGSNISQSVVSTGGLVTAPTAVTAGGPVIGTVGNNVLARGSVVSSPSVLVPSGASVRGTKPNSTSLPSSPISLTTGLKDDEGGFVGRRVGSSIGDVGIARSGGRATVTSSLGSGQSSPLVPMGTGAGPVASGGVGVSGGLGTAATLPDLRKTSLVGDERLLSGGLSQQLASPLSAPNRGFLPPGTASSATDTSSVAEGGIIGGRMFTPSVVSGGQWRPHTASSFQSQAELGQFHARTEIAPDQKQKFLQRLQQVHQQQHSAALLSAAQQLSHLSGTNQKQQQVLPPQQAALLQQGQLQLLHQQQGPLIQASQTSPLQQPQQQVGSPLSVQAQPISTATLQVSQQPPQVTQAQQSSTSLSSQRIVAPNVASTKEIDSAGRVGEQQQISQQKLADDMNMDTSVNAPYTGGVFFNDDDMKNADTFDVPFSVQVGGPGTLAELSQLSRDVDLAPGQPVLSSQSSTGPGVIGRRIISDLGAIGDNLTSSLAANTAVHDQLNNLQLLESSFHKIPLPKDSERSKSYVPKYPVSTPSSYPQVPVPIIDNPAFWERLETDVLFFSFYYQQGTYQQYLAARELKKQSWRYHKKYNTWFQRHEEPKVTTDEYEQGTYVYFDFHIVHDDFQQGWCQRIKTEFTFEYSYLEDELVV